MTVLMTDERVIAMLLEAVGHLGMEPESPIEDVMESSGWSARIPDVRPGGVIVLFDDRSAWLVRAERLHSKVAAQIREG